MPGSLQDSSAEAATATVAPAAATAAAVATPPGAGPIGRGTFKLSTQREIATRAHYLCSNPECRRQTAWPHSNQSKTVKTGEAAHIWAASIGGPRYDDCQTDGERTSIENAIWLCVLCHTKIDNDPDAYPAESLLEWKETHEKWIKDGFKVVAVTSEPQNDFLKNAIQEIFNFFVGERHSKRRGRRRASPPVDSPPVATQPAVAQFEVIQPEFDQLDIVKFDIVQPEVDQLGIAQFDAVQSDTAHPEVGQPTAAAANIVQELNQPMSEARSSRFDQRLHPIDKQPEKRTIVPDSPPRPQSTANSRPGVKHNNIIPTPPANRTPNKSRTIQINKPTPKTRTVGQTRFALLVMACLLMTTITSTWVLVRPEFPEPTQPMIDAPKNSEHQPLMAPIPPRSPCVVCLMGQVKRPGTYELGSTPLTVKQAVDKIGGLSDDFAGKFQLTRDGHPISYFDRRGAETFQLQSGDLIVAESSDIIRTDAETDAEFVQIGFVNLLHRPVVLKLRIRHANIARVLELLNQESSIASRATVIQPTSQQSSGPPTADTMLASESVVLFPPNTIAKDRIPNNLPPVIQLTEPRHLERTSEIPKLLTPSPNAANSGTTKA